MRIPQKKGLLKGDGGGRVIDGMFLERYTDNGLRETVPIVICSQLGRVVSARQDCEY